MGIKDGLQQIKKMGNICRVEILRTPWIQIARPRGAKFGVTRLESPEPILARDGTR
jgi:hypothetical protein